MFLKEHRLSSSRLGDLNFLRSDHYAAGSYLGSVMTKLFVCVRMEVVPYFGVEDIQVLQTDSNRAQIGLLHEFRDQTNVYPLVKHSLNTMNNTCNLTCPVTLSSITLSCPAYCLIRRSP